MNIIFRREREDRADSPSARGSSPLRAFGIGVLSLAMSIGGAPAFAAPASSSEPTPAESTPAAIDQSVKAPAAGVRDGAVISPSLQEAQGQVTAFVELAGSGAYAATAGFYSSFTLGREVAPASQTAAVKSIQAQVQAQGAQLAAESNAQVLYTTHNLQRGVALSGDAEAIRALASRPDVVRISPVVLKQPTNSVSDVNTHAVQAWQQSHATGKGVTIAVIDTGIDYTHADFGGPGTAAAYQRAKASSTIPAGLYDPAKFVGGYDLVGDAYTGYNTPTPDSNPLDCSDAGHGSHVAGTAAGYGVNSDGTTFRGAYDQLTTESVQQMKIGPGSAPEARLVALRVFGCKGASAVAGEAMDRALDPNGDGDFSDRADIVNLSLGSDYSVIDDPESLMLQRLVDADVLAVVAAGNAAANLNHGDAYSILGAPANNPAALTVANSQAGITRGDRYRVTSPADLAGDYAGSYGYSYKFARGDEHISGTVTAAPESNKTGCLPFVGTDFNGKWALLYWEAKGQDSSCGSTQRVAAAGAAGAKGVLLVAPEHDTKPISGHTTIPSIQITTEQAKKFEAAAASGTLQIEMAAEWQNIALDFSSKDTIAESTSRGLHGSYGFVKPDVSAPGTRIESAKAGGGSNAAQMTGTSMSTPHVAGIAAQLMAANPSMSAQQVKMRIMNTARGTVTGAQGESLGGDRIGAGRVDAALANTENSYVYNAQHPEYVSLAFGVVEVVPGSGTRRYTREVTVENTGDKERTFSISYADRAGSLRGAEFSVQSSVTVPAHSTVNVPVTLTVDPDQLVKTLDSGSERDQLGKARQYLSSLSGNLEFSDSASTLLLPVHAAPKPASTLSYPANALAFGSGTTATLKPSGTELKRGGYYSLLGAFELGYENPDQSMSEGGKWLQVAYTGASSNVPAKRAANDTRSPSTLSFAVVTKNNWSVLTPSFSMAIEIDTDNDGTADYELRTRRTTGLDYPLALLTNKRTGYSREADAKPVNGVWGSTDSNIFDTNMAVLPVSLSSLGLAEQDGAGIHYRSVTQYSPDGMPSYSDWAEFNPYAPKLWFEGSARGLSLLEDSASSPVTAHRAEGTSPKALLLHMHNASASTVGTQNLKNADGNALTRVQVLESNGEAVVPSHSEEPTPQPSPSASASASPSVAPTPSATPSVSPKPSVAPTPSPSSSAPSAKPNEPVLPTPRTFSDVKQGDTFSTEIYWLAASGITTGYPDNTFRPLQNVERAAMAAYFYRMAGKPDVNLPATSPFSDVDPSFPFYKEIVWMKQQGITTGYPDGTFRPHDPVNRDAMAAFFYRYDGRPAYSAPAVSPFADVSQDNMFYREISWLASQKVTTGWPDGTYRPWEPIHRDAMAAFIYRYDHR